MIIEHLFSYKQIIACIRTYYSIEPKRVTLHLNRLGSFDGTYSLSNIGEGSYAAFRLTAKSASQRVAEDTAS